MLISPGNQSSATLRPPWTGSALGRLPRLLGRTVVAGALVCCVAGMGAVPASAAATTTWRADGYGPGNTGYNPVETTITTETVDTVKYRWSVVSPVVRLTCSRQGPPVVANGKVYVSDQGGIGAYDVSTGAKVWSFRFPSAAEETVPTLAVVGTRLFMTTNYCQSMSDPNGYLRVFDANTGAALWQVNRDAPMLRTVVDKDVVVVSGDSMSDDPLVTGYRVSDGAVLWNRTGDLPRAVSANGRLLLTRAEEPGSDLVDIRTGAALWSSDSTWSVLASGPAGGPLYAAGSAGELVRINVENGTVAWSVPGAAAQLSVDDSRLYVARGSELVVRAAATGAEVWRKTFSAQLGKPVIAGGVVYATTSGQRMDTLNAATGAVLDWDSSYDGAIGHPVVVNGALFVTDGRLLDAFGL